MRVCYYHKEREMSFSRFDMDLSSQVLLHSCTLFPQSASKWGDIPVDRGLPRSIHITAESNLGDLSLLTQMPATLAQVPCWLRQDLAEKAYHSRTLNKTECRYCVTRRELLTVVSAIKHFKYYLGCLHYAVRTGCSALQWLIHT